MMAYGEAYWYHYEKTLLGITIGTGIGSGLVVRDQIYRGMHYNAMELGHTIVQPDGRLCKCGKYGCVEAYSSATGLLEQGREILADVNGANVNDGDSISIKQILELGSVNKRVQEMIGKSIRFLALSIANAITLLDVDIVSIGGGVADIDAFPFQTLRKENRKIYLARNLRAYIY